MLALGEGARICMRSMSRMQWEHAFFVADSALWPSGEAENIDPKVWLRCRKPAGKSACRLVATHAALCLG